jgi:prepilin signal peptidase PulO-like enzyme (type II secretory pathway)
MESRFESAQTIIAIYSLFFTIVSAYIAALYFFIGRAPFPLRFTAFTLLTISFLFLAAVTASVTEVVEVLITQWNAADIPPGPNERIRLIFLENGADSVLYYSGLGLATATGVLVYLVLAHLTFFYRWTPRDDMRE